MLCHMCPYKSKELVGGNLAFFTFYIKEVSFFYHRGDYQVAKMLVHSSLYRFSGKVVKLEFSLN